jgi:signal transduction histidine kinase
MHLEAAQSLPAEQAQKHVQQAEQMARENLQQARYLVEDLHPKRLQEASLPDAIMTTVQQWREQSKVVAHVTVTGEERPLPANTEHTLLRATQEALANIHKHAQANEVTITLSYMDDLVMLDVQDDGVGLNGTTSAWQGGFGLTAMRERIEQLGGSLLVESEDGEGTTVVVSIPVDSDQ